MEGSIGSRGTENGDYAKDTKSLKDIESVGTVEVHRKGKKIYRKEKAEEKGRKEFEDGGEACSGTEEGDNANSSKRKVDFGTSNVKKDKSARQGQKKRSKKLFFGGISFDTVANCLCSSMLLFCNFVLLLHHLGMHKIFIVLLSVFVRGANFNIIFGAGFIAG